MEVSSASGSHLGHSHGGSASNISINAIGGGMGGPNDGKVLTKSGGRKPRRHARRLHNPCIMFFHDLYR